MCKFWEDDVERCEFSIEKYFATDFEFDYYKDKLIKLKKRDKEIFIRQFFDNKQKFSDKAIRYFIYFIGFFITITVALFQLNSYTFPPEVILLLVILGGVGILFSRKVTDTYVNLYKRDLDQYLDFLVKQDKRIK